MTDIVERLRLDAEPTESDMEEAATEIERLRAENERLREALRDIDKHMKRMTNIDLTIWEIARAALREDE